MFSKAVAKRVLSVALIGALASPLALTRMAAAAVPTEPSAALTYTSTGTSFPLIVVDNGVGFQGDPHVSGRYAVYTDVDVQGTSTIKYFDFATQTRGSLSQPIGVVDQLSDTSNGSIVFTRLTADGASHIMSSSPGGTPTEVAPLAPPTLPQRRNPAIGGSTIAWEDCIDVFCPLADIVVLSGSVSTRLTNDAALNVMNRNPNVSSDGSVVVWEKCSTPNTCDIYAAVKSGTSWTVSAIATTTANETSPDTNGPPRLRPRLRRGSRPRPRAPASRP